MKFHKRLLAASLALFMLASAGCDAKEKKPAKDNDETEVEEQEEEPTETEGSTTETTNTPAETTFVIVDNTYEFTTKNFPTIDGSTSTKPMASAIKSLLLGMDREEADESMEFHKTSKSFEYLMSGEADILIVAQPSEEVFQSMDDKNFDYEMEPFALEALVFVCNVDNPVDSLTHEQIVDIYTGKITNWKEVGGNDEPIIAVQRNHSSGSQVMMDNLVMQGEEMMEADTDLMPADMGELIEVVQGFDNSAQALGYTPYYYATSMGMASGLKILKVNDVEPNNETIKSGEYPFINPYYVVISADADEGSPERRLFDWILSPDGQKLTEMEGYVPARGE